MTSTSMDGPEHNNNNNNHDPAVAFDYSTHERRERVGFITIKFGDKDRAILERASRNDTIIVVAVTAVAILRTLTAADWLLAFPLSVNNPIQNL